MRYFDRDNQLISQEHWSALYRDQSYSLLRVDRFSLLDAGAQVEIEISTTWIGVKFDCEDRTVPFLVQIKTNTPVKDFLGKEKRELTTAEYFFNREIDALEHHEKLMAEHLTEKSHATA